MPLRPLGTVPVVASAVVVPKAGARGRVDVAEGKLHIRWPSGAELVAVGKEAVLKDMHGHCADVTTTCTLEPCGVVPDLRFKARLVGEEVWHTVDAGREVKLYRRSNENLVSGVGVAKSKGRKALHLRLQWVRAHFKGKLPVCKEPGRLSGLDWKILDALLIPVSRGEPVSQNALFSILATTPHVHGGTASGGAVPHHGSPVVPSPAVDGGSVPSPTKPAAGHKKPAARHKKPRASTSTTPAGLVLPKGKEGKWPNLDGLTFQFTSRLIGPTASGRSEFPDELGSRRGKGTVYLDIRQKWLRIDMGRTMPFGDVEQRMLYTGSTLEFATSLNGELQVCSEHKVDHAWNTSLVDALEVEGTTMIKDQRAKQFVLLLRSSQSLRLSLFFDEETDVLLALTVNDAQKEKKAFGTVEVTNFHGAVADEAFGVNAKIREKCTVGKAIDTTTVDALSLLR